MRVEELIDCLEEYNKYEIFIRRDFKLYDIAFDFVLKNEKKIVLELEEMEEDEE